MRFQSKTSVSSKRYVELYKCYMEFGTVKDVVSKTGASETIVKRLRKRDRWEEDRIKVLDEVRATIGDKRPQEIIDTLAEIGNIKKSILLAIMTSENMTKLGPSDYDKMIRLERFLQGEPDSRPDNKSIMQQVNYDGLSEEEIDAKVERSFEVFFAGNGGPKSRF